MDGEASSINAISHRHRHYMVIGRKKRYTEVFQHSGEDMGIALSGSGPRKNGHVKEGHNLNLNGFPCKRCPKTYKTTSNLRKHQRKYAHLPAREPGSPRLRPPSPSHNAGGGLVEGLPASPQGGRLSQGHVQGPGSA